MAYSDEGWLSTRRASVVSVDSRVHQANGSGRFVQIPRSWVSHLAHGFPCPIRRATTDRLTTRPEGRTMSHDQLSPEPYLRTDVAPPGWRIANATVMPWHAISRRAVIRSTLRHCALVTLASFPYRWSELVSCVAASMASAISSCISST